MSPFWEFSVPTSVLTWLSTLRILPVRPSIISLSSWVMLWICPTPPPVSTSDKAPRTSSTSGLRPVRSIGMTSLGPSFPVLAGVASAPGSATGADSSTNFSPSRLV